MTVALNRPFVADLRQPGVTGRRCGPTIVEMIGADDKPQALPPYSGPPPPQMHHRIPPEAAHGLVNAPGAYDQPWRPYPPSFEHHHAEQRRASNPPQPSLPPHGYPVIPNRELPQLPPEGPYGRPNSLPAPSLTPTESHAPTFRPMNGASHDSIPHSAPTHPGPPPHSAPSDFRPRMTYPPQEQSSNGETPPPLLQPRIRCLQLSFRRRSRIFRILLLPMSRTITRIKPLVCVSARLLGLNR